MKGKRLSLSSPPTGSGQVAYLRNKRGAYGDDPLFNVICTLTGVDGKTRFHKVGVAFPQREDAKSVMKIKLHAYPTNGEIVLFAPKPGNKEDVRNRPVRQLTSGRSQDRALVVLKPRPSRILTVALR